MILHRALCGNQIKEPVEYVPISTGWDRPRGHLYTPALHCQHHPNDKISRFIRLNCEIHDLLKKLASTKAQHTSLLEGRPVSDSEQGLILHHLRRRLSVFHHHSPASLPPHTVQPHGSCSQRSCQKASLQ